MDIQLYKIDNDARVKNIFKRYLNSFYGCYISGGCFRSLFTYKKPKDIDIFFESADAFHIAIAKVKSSSEYEYMYSTDHCEAYKDLVRGVTVEFIHFIYFPTIYDIFLYFDFTISKYFLFKPTKANTNRANIIIDINNYNDDDFNNETAIFLNQFRNDCSIFETVTYDESYICHHIKYFEHLCLRKIVCDKPTILNPINAFHLGNRYAKYGFRLCINTRRKIMIGLYAENKNLVNHLSKTAVSYDDMDIPDDTSSNISGNVLDDVLDEAFRDDQMLMASPYIEKAKEESKGPDVDKTKKSQYIERTKKVSISKGLKKVFLMISIIFNGSNR